MKGRVAIVVLVQILMLVSVARVSEAKKINFQMWLYDKITSPNVTGVRVAGPNGDTSKTQFGSLFVIDNQILDGPNFTTANEIGRAKGTFMIAAVDVSHATLIFSAVLQSPKFNGTIAFQGTDKSVGPLGSKEIAVLGGTGDFRAATGYATYTTTYLDIPDSVVLFDTFLMLPDF